MKNDWVMKTFTFQTAYLVWLLTDSLLFGGSRQGRRRLTRSVTGSMAAETEGARRAESRAFQQKLSTLCDWQIQEVQRRNTSVISSSRLEQRKKKIVDYHFKGSPHTHTLTHSHTLADAVARTQKRWNQWSERSGAESVHVVVTPQPLWRWGCVQKGVWRQSNSFIRTYNTSVCVFLMLQQVIKLKINLGTFLPLLFPNYHVHGRDHLNDLMSKWQSNGFHTLAHAWRFSLTLCPTHMLISSRVAAEWNDTLESHQLSGKINSSDWRAH